MARPNLTLNPNPKGLNPNPKSWPKVPNQNPNPKRKSVTLYPTP